jgi:predicted metal-dependent peptidase
MSAKNINDEISRCIIQMLISEPYYAHFLSGIVRNVTEEIPTAAVGLNNTKVTLYINPNFFLKELTTFSSRVAVIKHETLHLLFKHLFRLDLKKYNAKLFNIAADLVVNQFIGKWDLPKSAVTLSSFPDLDLTENESLEWYYDKIVKLKRKVDKNDSKSKDNGDSKSNNKNNQNFPIESAKALKGILKNKTHSDHSKWGVSEDIPLSKHAETELDRLIVQTKERISVDQYQSLPESIKDLIKLIIEKRNPKVNWKRALNIFSSSSRNTKIKFTYKKVSKRYGTRPGIKIRRKQKMAVAIDTSASIPLQEFNFFFSEIHSIWKNGAEIEVIECDDIVQRSYEYKGIFPMFVEGRGGTSFDPVFDYINRDRNVKYDGCIYLTDGYANEPRIKPRCKVFWVITPDGEVGPHLKYGRVVKINN